jgi:hypothetical protein
MHEIRSEARGSGAAMWLCTEKVHFKFWSRDRELSNPPCAPTPPLPIQPTLRLDGVEP